MAPWTGRRADTLQRLRAALREAHAEEPVGRVEDAAGWEFESAAEGAVVSSTGCPMRVWRWRMGSGLSIRLAFC